MSVTLTLSTFPIPTGITDITDHNLKMILGMVWALILHYQIEMGNRQKPTKEPLLVWIQTVLPDNSINNLTSDWSDGRNLSALVNHCKPGLIPNPATLDPKKRLENVRHAMSLAKQHLNIPMVMSPEDLIVERPEKKSAMTYLSQFWPWSKNPPTTPKKGMVTCLPNSNEDVHIAILTSEHTVVEKKPNPNAPGGKAMNAAYMVSNNSD